MSGPKIAALYGLIPNQLGFCGPQQDLLKKFIAGKTSIPEIIPVLEKFEAAYAYYELIAKKTRSRPDISIKELLRLIGSGMNSLIRLRLATCAK